jgi:uncharacterized protein YecT (DUF1311 family)
MNRDSKKAEWPIKGDRPTERPPAAIAQDRPRGLSPVLLAGMAIALLLLIVWLFSGNRSPDQDKLTGAGANVAQADTPEKRCASKATYDLIKRDLFRRAAQLRGSDQAAFDKLAAYAIVRMENPVLESEDKDSGAANCSGSLSLDLPPGVAVVGGKRTLTADVDYTVQQAADGSGEVVLLKNADPIVAPLATLARTSQPAPQPIAPAATTPTEPTLGPVPIPAPAPGTAGAPARPAPAPPAQTSARPSFNCANARTRGEIAVCGDSGLAALDRQMASQFGSAMADAGPGQRALLQRTRSRFLGYRDSCRTNACIADAYRGRIHEIRDILEGRWQPAR